MEVGPVRFLVLESLLPEADREIFLDSLPVFEEHSGPDDHEEGKDQPQIVVPLDPAAREDPCVHLCVALVQTDHIRNKHQHSKYTDPLQLRAEMLVECEEEGDFVTEVVLDRVDVHLLWQEEVGAGFFHERRFDKVPIFSLVPDALHELEDFFCLLR